MPSRGETGAVLLLAAALFAAGECRAAARGHQPVAAGAACVAGPCHARLLAAPPGARDAAVHEPAAAGDCVACHDLGLTAGSRFVKGAPADEAAAPGRSWDERLCAGCHDGLPEGPTAFTAGGRNLHALHVRAGRGRRCLSCHEPHRSRQPRLLREQIPAAGARRVEQLFRGEPQGGWCRTGCHAPKRYGR